MQNTCMLGRLKTLFGFLGKTILKRKLTRISSDWPEDAFNYLYISDRLAT